MLWITTVSAVARVLIQDDQPCELLDPVQVTYSFLKAPVVIKEIIYEEVFSKLCRKLYKHKVKLILYVGCFLYATRMELKASRQLFWFRI